MQAMQHETAYDGVSRQQPQQRSAAGVGLLCVHATTHVPQHARLPCMLKLDANYLQHHTQSFKQNDTQEKHHMQAMHMRGLAP
jgi:cytochrome c553